MPETFFATMHEQNIRHFLQHLTIERGLSPRSVESYGSDLRDFAAALDRRGIAAFADVRRDHILDYLGECQERGMENTTVARRLVAIRMLFRFLAAEGLVPRDETAVMDSPKLWKILPEFLTESEVEALLAVFSDRSDDPLEVRNRSILELLYASGLRVSEAAGLPLGAVDFDTEMIRVTGKGSKTRLVPVGRPALRVMKHYLVAARPLLAERNPRCHNLYPSRNGRPLDRERIWGIVRLAAETAGIAKPVHPHTLRHSFASHLLAHGGDLRVIQEMLGHADIATTEIYTHVDRNRLGAIHRKFHPRG